MTFTTRSVAPLLLAVAASSGCGFLFSQGPPAGHEKMESFNCTETDALAVLDIAWGLLNVTAATVVSTQREKYENPSTIIIVGFAWGAVSTASAITGFSNSNKCRAAKIQLAERQPAGPRTGAPLLQSVSLTPQNVTLQVGQTEQLVAQAYHSSGVAIPARDYKWSSSDTSIASVSGFGLVTAHAPGIVTIAASTGSLAGTSRVLVVEARE